MAMTMEAPASLVDNPVVPNATAKQKSEAVAEAKQTLDQANAELIEVGRENQNAAGQAAAEAQAESASVVDEEEKRFWAEISVLGKITDCSENMEECERRINELKEEVKVEKEMLKGEQHRLQKLAIELRKIKAGHPLPVDPNAAKDEERAKESASDDEPDDASSSDNTWRAKPTAELLDGLKGLGQKKLDVLCDAAPTAGDLEDLRGEASRAHLSFKDKLPAGFGQKIADAIEDRLIEHVAKCAPSAEEQAAAERGNADQGDEPEAINFDKITIEIRERLKIESSEAGAKKDDFVPSDLDDNDDPLVDGWHTFMNGEPINAVAEADIIECESDARNWLYGWLSSQLVHNWDKLMGKQDQAEADDQSAGEQYEDVDEDDIP